MVLGGHHIHGGNFWGEGHEGGMYESDQTKFKFYGVLLLLNSTDIDLPCNKEKRKLKVLILILQFM